MSPVVSFWRYAWYYSQEQIIKFQNIHPVHSEELCGEVPQVWIMYVEFTFFEPQIVQWMNPHTSGYILKLE